MSVRSPVRRSVRAGEGRPAAATGQARIGPSEYQRVTRACAYGGAREGRGSERMTCRMCGMKLPWYALSALCSLPSQPDKACAYRSGIRMRYDFPSVAFYWRFVA